MVRDDYFNQLIKEKNKGAATKKFTISILENDYKLFAEKAVFNHDCTSVQERIVQLIKSDIKGYHKNEIKSKRTVSNV